MRHDVRQVDTADQVDIDDTPPDLASSSHNGALPPVMPALFTRYRPSGSACAKWVAAVTDNSSAGVDGVGRKLLFVRPQRSAPVHRGRVNVPEDDAGADRSIRCATAADAPRPAGHDGKDDLQIDVHGSSKPVGERWNNLPITPDALVAHRRSWGAAGNEDVDGRNKSGHDGYLQNFFATRSPPEWAEHLPRSSGRGNLEADPSTMRQFSSPARRCFWRACRDRYRASLQPGAHVAADHRRSGVQKFI